jgi:phenylacetic acid degradation operon negative regulatory protein
MARKLLRPRDILLLALAGGLDTFSEFVNLPMASGFKNLYGWIPPRYRKSNYYQIVSHSMKTGYIEKVIKQGEVYLQLTSKGKKKLIRRFSLLNMQKKKWDKKWRIVIFDIAEVDKRIRDKLRQKLKELGFGMLQQSVWITPYNMIVDFREFIKSQGLGENVFVLETRTLLAGDYRKLAEQVWPIRKINKEYEHLLSPMIKSRDRVKISKEDLKRNLERVRRGYLEILQDDPCLPRELLPDDWYRDKVEMMLKKYK